MNFSLIQLLVLDVDGVLTPGDVTYDDGLARSMSFSIQDGVALKLWKQAGCRAAVLSGRETSIVVRRGAEVGIEIIRQGVRDKLAGLRALLDEVQAPFEAVCYVGDDLPDAPAVESVGFGVAVANAVPAVKRCSDFVTRRRGGDGAVAEVIEYLLRKQGRWATPASS